MTQVIAFDELYRKPNCEYSQKSEIPRPNFSAIDVWSKDYTKIDAVVYGLLATRHTLRYYTQYPDALDKQCMNVLEAAQDIEETGTEKLKLCVAPLKKHILKYINEENSRHLKTALLILDLVEKSPLYIE